MHDGSYDAVSRKKVRLKVTKFNFNILTYFSQKYGSRCKQRAIIFYGGRVIAHFVPNFVVMATEVDQG